MGSLAGEAHKKEQRKKEQRRCTVTVAPAAEKMVKRSEGKSAWSWAIIKLPAQLPALRTATLATRPRWLARGAKEVEAAVWGVRNSERPPWAHGVLSKGRERVSNI